MTTLTLGRIALVSALAIAPGSMACAQEGKDDPSREAKDGRGKWLPVFRAHAADYRVSTGPDAKAEMLPEPLLRWWQPIRGGDDGALYLWVEKGRPVAAVTFFTFKWPSGERVVIHERHSLASGPVEASWRDQPPWHPSAPGLVFKRVPDAPPPAAGEAARLRQMQALVRDVSATTTDDKGSVWKLRALNRPLHRYAAPDQGLADGALFALVQGTDPEVFFALEARGQGKDARWEYAIARFTDLEPRVQYRGVEVFHEPRTLGDATKAYFCNTMASKRSESPDDFR